MRPMTKMNLSNNQKPLMNPMNQKKPSEDDIDNFFTDLSYPAGYQ